VLEYANELTSKGYKLDEVGFPAQGRHGAGINAFGRAVVLHHPDGTPIVKADPAVKGISGLGQTISLADCDQNEQANCKKLGTNQNHFAHELKSYKSVPDYLRQAGIVYGLFGPPSQRGVY
jgi:hypothetical protein